MYLHEDRELFQQVIEFTSESQNIEKAIVEKDYYVTMILKLLSQKLNNVVFKGGTSLSKGYHVLNRFSEDIDITFDGHIGEARRKKLKYNVMKSISDELNMPISNWNSIQSDRDYNYYLFEYVPIDDYVKESLLPGVKVETALASYAFPTETRKIDNYVRRFLEIDNAEIIMEYELEEFEMKIQALERTYIDKVFALCDYYMEGKSERCSRHLYDIYKLSISITVNENLLGLVKEVRNHRAKMKICPSAKDGIDIKAMVEEFLDNQFYKNDYESITNYFILDFVSYEEAAECLRKIVNMGLFDEE